MNHSLDANRVFSVLELNSAVKAVLNREFPDSVWVHGEIQDYNKNRFRQHIFFKLCQKHPEKDQIVAQATAVIFEGRKEKLVQILTQAQNQFQLQDGIEVKLLCRLDFYAQSGRFTLIVESIDPIYTLGRLAQNRQKIVLRLKARGLLDKNKQLELSPVPLRIGLITAYESAAFNDFLDEMKKSKFGFKVYFFESSMQGKNVEVDVCNALAYFENLGFLDCAVITRGGGSTADLSWFDSEKIAQEIANCRIPVLTGIGHEINLSIADMVSFKYEKTPTAIAKFLINRVAEFSESLDEINKSIIGRSEDLIVQGRRRLELISAGFDSLIAKYFISHKQDLAKWTGTLRVSSLNRLDVSSSELKRKTQELSFQTRYYLKNIKAKLKHFEEKAGILDPMNTVKRGFSITRLADGRTLRSVKDVKEKERITTIVADGKVQSQVQEIEGED
jgi:exodeoxyribonuclease VII large subunit